MYVILRIAPPGHGESFAGAGRSRLNLLGILYPQECGAEGLAQTDRARMEGTITEERAKMRFFMAELRRGAS